MKTLHYNSRGEGKVKHITLLLKECLKLLEYVNLAR